jgi:putative PIN family toxin of toxin-antitoxin system
MTDGGTPRVVYDCNIFVQALLSTSGAAGECIRRAMAKEVALYLSKDLLSEIRETPFKPTPRKLGITVERTEHLISTLLEVSTVVNDVPLVFQYERDPDDAHYINLALAAQARLVVSRDRDLLDLMDHAKAEAIAFQKRFPDLRILEPAEFLKELAKKE